jgi:hypothetical protein
MIVPLLIVAVLCFALPANAAQFFDLATALGLPGAIGAAWGDYDEDGYADLILTSVASGHWPMLLHNNGNLTFTDVSGAMGLPATIDEQDGVAWADYDNDGRLDFIIASGSGSVKLYHNNGTTFTDVGAAAGMGPAAGPGRGVAWCDYDADGWLDVFICNTMGNVCHLMRNNGDSTFSDATEAAGMTGLAIPSAGNAAAWGDFDNDGTPDLVLSRMGTRPLLYGNNGDGTFTEVGLAAALSVASDTFGVAWADYDNDGWLDCYLGSATGVCDWLFHNNGDGTFTDVAATAGMASDASVGVGVAWADYNNDGFADLYVGNSGEAFLYHNSGNGTFADVAASSGVAGGRPNEAACWADMNLDGRMDLFSAVGGPLSALFYNIGAAGNWLRVRTLTSGVGDATGGWPVRDAIGTRVELNLDNDDSFPTAGHRTLTRLIDGGSGFLSQNEQIAHFGLGSATLVTVRVRFPDGSVVTHRSVPANTQIAIRDVWSDRIEIFDDVPLDFWAYEQIRGCVDSSIVAGYDDGLYHPDWPVTRDQMAVYISRALAGGDDNVPDFTDTPTFPDVAEDNWALDYIEYAVEQGVVTGYDDGNYHPEYEVTRDQMAVYVARALVAPSGEAGLADYTPADPRNFPDVADTSWAYKHIEYCVENGVVQGYLDGLYHPEITVTRDQMAVYVARAFGL